MSTHEMIPAPVPGGMACKNCKAYSTEIAYALGPVCAKAPAPTPAQPVDETERLAEKCDHAGGKLFLMRGGLEVKCGSCGATSPSPFLKGSADAE